MNSAFDCPNCGYAVKLIGCRTLRCANTGCRWTRLLPIIKEPGTSVDALLYRARVCLTQGNKTELWGIIEDLGRLARKGETE